MGKKIFFSVALLGMAAGAQQARGADRVLPEAPWADAAAVWHLGDLGEATGQHRPLRIVGDGVKAGIALTGAERGASLARGGDGRIASFDGKSWLSLDREQGRPPLPSPEAMSLYVRMRAVKPGGIIHTNLFSLVLHESGIAVGIIGLADKAGRMYREIPLSPLTLNEWHDVVVRYRAGALDFIVDGSLMNRITLAERPQAIVSGPLVLGGWRMDSPPLPASRKV